MSEINFKKGSFNNLPNGNSIKNGSIYFTEDKGWLFYGINTQTGENSFTQELIPILPKYTSLFEPTNLEASYILNILENIPLDNKNALLNLPSNGGISINDKIVLFGTSNTIQLNSFNNNNLYFGLFNTKDFYFGPSNAYSAIISSSEKKNEAGYGNVKEHQLTIGYSRNLEENFFNPGQILLYSKGTDLSKNYNSYIKPSPNVTDIIFYLPVKTGYGVISSNNKWDKENRLVFTSDNSSTELTISNHYVDVNNVGINTGDTAISKTLEVNGEVKGKQFYVGGGNWQSFLYFQPTQQENPGAYIKHSLNDDDNQTSVTKNQISFIQNSYANNNLPNGKSESFNLPNTEKNILENKNYDILTTKNIITTGQGGTGTNTHTSNRIVFVKDNNGTYSLSSNNYLYTDNEGKLLAINSSNSEKLRENVKLYVNGPTQSQGIIHAERGIGIVQDSFDKEDRKPSGLSLYGTYDGESIPVRGIIFTSIDNSRKSHFENTSYATYFTTATTNESWIFKNTLDNLFEIHGDGKAFLKGTFTIHDNIFIKKDNNPYIAFQNSNGVNVGYVQLFIDEANKETFALGAKMENSLQISSTGSISIPKDQTFTPRTSNTGSVGTSAAEWATAYIRNLKSGTNLYIDSGNSYNTNIVFRGGSTERARFNQHGCFNINSAQDTNTYKLYVNGETYIEDLITAKSGIGNGSSYLAFTKDGHYNSTAAQQLGQLIIALPKTGYKANSRIKFKVSIFNDSSDTSVDYIVSGYVSSTGEWKNATAICLSKKSTTHNNHPVKFYHDTTRNYVSIGLTNTKWAYPQITISEINIGYQADIKKWISDWSIRFSTDEISLPDRIITNTSIVYNSFYADRLTNISSGDVASLTATSRYVFISYDDLTTNRPAYDTRFTFQTSTGTLSLPNAILTGNINPSITNTGSIGTSNYEWATAYIRNLKSGTDLSLQCGGNDYKIYLKSGTSEIAHFNSTGITIADGKQIKRNGSSSSWWNGRDHALICQTSANGYSPILSMKTTAGSWEIGNYNYNDDWNDQLLFNYKDDISYAYKGQKDENNKSTNTVVHAFKLTKNGYLTLSSGFSVAGDSVINNGTLTFNHGTKSNQKITTSAGEMHYSSASTVYIDSGTGSSLIFRPCGSEKARFDTDGKFQIKTDLNLNNNNIDDVNSFSFYDPGPEEGITWKDGNGWWIYESPDDLSTNGKGNLQFVHKTSSGSTRRLTINKDGYIDINCRLVVRGNGSSWNEGIRILPASNGWSNAFFSADQSLSDTHDGGWLIGRRGASGVTYNGVTPASGDFTIEEESSDGVNLTIHKNSGGATLRGRFITDKYINANEGFGVNATTGTGVGISLYGGSTGTSAPQFGLMFAKTETFETFGGVTSNWATYFTMNDTTTRGWIFRRGSTNVCSIDGQGSIYSYINSTSADIYHKVANANGIVGIYASTNRGLYDFNRSKWIIYTQSSDNTTRVPEDLYCDKKLIMSGDMVIRNTNWTKGTAPTSETGRRISFVDSNGTETKNRSALIYSYIGTDNTSHFRLYNYKPEANATTNSYLDLSCTSDGTTSAHYSGGSFKTARLIATSTTDADATKEAGVALITGSPTGQHLEIDGNEIVSKTNGTTGGNLYLNEGGTGIFLQCSKLVVGAYGTESNRPTTDLTAGQIYFQYV